MAIAETINPAVDIDFLTPIPRVLDDRGAAEILSLGADIDLAKSIQADRGIHRRQLILSPTGKVLNVAQPVVDEPVPGILHGRLHSATAGME